jgi:hypothetical protein
MYYLKTAGSFLQNDRRLAGLTGMILFDSGRGAIWSVDSQSDGHRDLRATRGGQTAACGSAGRHSSPVVRRRRSTQAPGGQTLRDKIQNEARAMRNSPRGSEPRKRRRGAVAGRGQGGRGGRLEVGDAPDRWVPPIGDRERE